MLAMSCHEFSPTYAYVTPTLWSTYSDSCHQIGSWMYFIALSTWLKKTQCVYHDMFTESFKSITVQYILCGFSHSPFADPMPDKTGGIFNQFSYFTCQSHMCTQIKKVPVFIRNILPFYCKYVNYLVYYQGKHVTICHKEWDCHKKERKLYE